MGSMIDFAAKYWAKLFLGVVAVLIMIYMMYSVYVATATPGI